MRKVVPPPSIPDLSVTNSIKTVYCRNYAAGLDSPHFERRFSLAINAESEKLVWQNRFYSCVLNDAHWETALRYVELNPVRARLAKTAEEYRWSSARVAAVRRAHPPLLGPGSGDFLQNLERTYQILLRALPIGRPRKGPAIETPIPIPAIQSTTA